LQGQALRVLAKISTLRVVFLGKILAPGRLSDFSVHNKNMERKSSIYKQSCMLKQEDQTRGKNQSGVTTEPVSINRKETIAERIKQEY